MHYYAILRGTRRSSGDLLGDGLIELDIPAQQALHIQQSLQLPSLGAQVCTIGFLFFSLRKAEDWFTLWFKSIGFQHSIGPIPTRA